jgi:solute:Na+ symporter, SSS family
MTFIVLYWIILFSYSIAIWLRKKSPAAFLVNDRSSSTFGVSMSLVSLVFGASSVFGLAGYAHVYSLNAMWWTLSGVICLFILRFLFIEGILSLKAYTISDAVEKVFGVHFKTVTSVLIFIPWIMILAGQIIAGGTIITLITGNRELSYILFCLIFFSYTVITGQTGTVRTSFLQTIIMTAGVIALLIYAVYAYNSLPSQNAVFHFGSTEKFTPMFLLNIALPVGLSYLFGPDIYSRIFTAKNVSSAKRGIAAASIIIIVISGMIVVIGILGGQILGTVTTPDEIIPRLASLGFNGFFKTLILVALVSIPLSGADAMLANMGTLLGKDIAGGIRFAFTGQKIDQMKAVVSIRIAIALAAALAVFAALHSKEIIPTLLIAYRIFSVVAVPLIMISMLSIKFNVVWKSTPLKAGIAVYMMITAVLISLIELKIIISGIPYLYLYFLLINLVVFLSLFFIARNFNILKLLSRRTRRGK